MGGGAESELCVKTLQTELLQARAALASDQAALAELEAGSRSEDIAEAKATLSQAQSQLANVQGGASSEEIAQAQAQLNSAKAEADLTKQRVQRYLNLKDEVLIALDAYEQSLKEEKQAIADVQAGQRRLSQLKLRFTPRHDFFSLDAGTLKAQRACIRTSVYLNEITATKEYLIINNL